MAKEIVQDGTPVLREVAQEVPADFFGTEKLQNMIAEMEQSLHPEIDGVALAAPQIGIPYRIFIIRFDRMRPQTEEERAGNETPEIGVFINPVITKTSRKKMHVEEACLSARGLFGITERFEQVTVRAQDVDGNSFTRGAGGLLAQAFQHEIDHLNGILFVDHADDIMKYIPPTNEHA